jgi:site-specific DNA recombinase
VRGVIYARYSSENQNERSIDDQVALCRELAARHGHDIVEIYADYAISGSSLKNRPQANRMMAEARAGRFDVVLAEALDRLSRDQEDVAGIHKRLRFAGIGLVTASEGAVDELHIGLKGTMNALFVRDLAAKIRRGQKGRAAEGLVAGGRSYGYDVVREFDSRGEPVRGKRRIDEAKAAIVRRIFTAYVAGESPRAIAAALNRGGIAAPAGGAWNTSTINGNRGRRNGILHNEAYIGVLTYNRTTFIKDPDTGRRLARLNPVDQWIVAPAPQLRIVSDALWDGAQARRARYAGYPIHQRRRPRHLFSGLVRCGVCGGAYTIKSEDKLACSAHREQGTCDNGRTVRIAALERRALEGIRTRLLAPDAVAAFVQEYHAERRRLAADRHRRRETDAAQLAELDRQIANIVDAIAEGVASPAMKTRLAALEGRRGALAQDTATAAQKVVGIHPRTVDVYRRAVSELETTIACDAAGRGEAMEAVRSLVSRIDVHPLPERGQFQLKVHGLIAALLTLPSATNKQGTRGTVMMVAGEGFEPPTLGL